MQEIEFSCISCRSALSADKVDVGKLVQCPSCNQTMKVPRYGVVAGMKLGDFKVLKCLGVGGMGEVWLAEQESLNRKVALKILSPDISHDENFINRFRQEVKIAGKLIHPNIVVAFQAGEQNGIRYLTCAYVDGMVASEVIENNGALDEPEVLKIGRDIAKGLKYAWEKVHILHRDVKPDNIMISKDGTPMLMDMGISKNFEEDVSLTMTGEIIGTPNYISPEQAHAADDIDFRSDQYSLGATLFHLLTGMLPYRATSAMGILAQHLQDPVPDAQEYNPQISIECSRMIMKMMAKKPEDRYQSWDEVIIYANSLLPPEMRDGTMLPGTLKAPKSRNKKPFLIGVLAGIAVITLLFSVVLYNKWTKWKSKKSQQIVKVKTDRTNIKTNNTGSANHENKKRKITDQKPVIDSSHISDDSIPEISKKNPDINRDRFLELFKKRITSSIKEKFKVSESDAEILADKMIKIHLMKRELANPAKSTAENRKVLKTEFESLRNDFKNSVSNILGENGWEKFDKFMRNELIRNKRQHKPFDLRRR